MQNLKFHSLKFYLISLVFGIFFFGCAEAQELGDESNWIPLQVIDVNKLPWDSRYRMGHEGTSSGKLLFSEKGGGTLLYIKFNPGGSADGIEAHYHTFHEWGYILKGDFPVYEHVSPNQKKGTLVKMRPGTFMDRPAYSIHGNRASTMEDQIVTPGSTQLLFYEPGKTVSLNPENRSYSDEWKDVEEFFSANFQHSATTDIMEWEEDNELPGVYVKWLSDHLDKGYMAKLRYAPSGWSHPKKGLKKYNKQGYRFIYILSGDMKIQSFNGLGENPSVTIASEDFFISQAPFSIWSWGESELTQQGVTWLEIQYGKGTVIGQGPIQSPVVIKE